MKTETLENKTVNKEELLYMFFQVHTEQRQNTNTG